MIHTEDTQESRTVTRYIIVESVGRDADFLERVGCFEGQ